MLENMADLVYGLAARTATARTSARSFRRFARRFKGRGIEIGGPSSIFERGQLLPVYQKCAALDGCNFADSTFWEGKLVEGETFRFGGRLGKQMIAEASSLPVPSSSYDFVLSSHMLEHSANPIGVLIEWRRVLKAGGHLLLVLPDKRRTFDHLRPLTTLQHVIDDFTANRSEDDRTHVEEMLANVDLSMTPGSGNREEMAEWLRGNYINRGVHHHVFDHALARAIVRYAGYELLASEEAPPHHIIVIARHRPEMQAMSRS